MSFFKDFIYLFLGRGEGREKERERNIDVCFPLTCPQLGTMPTTQLCAWTGNQTSDPLVCRLVLNPLGHTGHVRCSYILTDPAIPLLGIYTKEMKTGHRKGIYTPMYCSNICNSYIYC